MRETRHDLEESPGNGAFLQWTATSAVSPPFNASDPEGPMPRPLIEYYQEVLSKISFADRAVFRKELRKAYKRLEPADRDALKIWFRSSCICKVDPAPGDAAQQA